MTDKGMRDCHDLSLGKWGPYNKKHLGACHIANTELGVSFNIELFPALYRRSVAAASAFSGGDVRMWGANAERTSFVYRYELEWKDRVYCDARFDIADDRCVFIDCEFVNNTDKPQSVNMFLSAGLEYPTKSAQAVVVGHKELSEVKNLGECRFVDAVDYADIACAEALAQDGKYLGECEADFATGKGTLIGAKHFFEPEHFLAYELDGVSADSLLLRYRAGEDTQVTVTFDSEKHTLKLSKCREFSTACLNFDVKTVKSVVISPSGTGVDVDSFVIGRGAADAEFSKRVRTYSPEIKRVEDSSMLLKYSDSEYFYRIKWEGEPLMLRTLYTDDVGSLLARTIHDHVATERRDGYGSEGVYEIVRTNPIYLEPHSRGRMKFTVISYKAGEACDEPTPKKHGIYSVKTNSDGEKYAFSQNMMAYNTLLNVVYPIYTRRTYIRHSTPGRIWNCLYTWDSGFIGMGLSTIDFKAAYENLAAYLTPVGDRHSPYIFHGSVVPTQIFLYQELFNRFPERHEELRALYPSVMQYYKFFSELSEGEEQMKSGMLKTWHIFYNSGGWDDYPPQRYVSRESLSAEQRRKAPITPVITTAVTVLIAKILKNISRVLGIHENDALFERDIERYSAAIETHTWDDEAGYYSYLVHDECGNPTGFLRYSDGTNYNMGLDGAYPYIAGISSADRSARVLENIKCGMMTEYGVGVVDTRAPYYTPYGYWNGSVWMPHQWILAKALLDRGEVDFAVEIAKRALDVWAREVDESYFCFEQFMSQNGRGSGFHQFSGLSTPVLMFFEWLYSPGHIATGFSVNITKAEWNEDKTALKAEAVSNCDGATLIFCMSDKCKYKFTINGKPAEAKQLSGGSYALKLCSAGEFEISVSEK